MGMTLDCCFGGERDSSPVKMISHFGFPDGKLQQHGNILQIFVVEKHGINGIEL
jgi:hypothetical protein